MDRKDSPPVGINLAQYGLTDTAVYVSDEALNSASSAIDFDYLPGEPRVRFRQTGKILDQDDCSTCLTCSDKFFVIGTLKGCALVVACVVGTVVQESRKPLHDQEVTSVSLDRRCDFLASSSRDGKVVIVDLGNRASTISFNYGEPVLCVALDPNFATTRRFVYSTSKGIFLATATKSIVGLFRNSDTSLGRDSVSSITWRSGLIVWATKQCLVYHDTQALRSVSIADVKFTDEWCNDWHRCNLVWLNDQVLTISWGRMYYEVKFAPTGTGQLPARPLAILRSLTLSASYSGVVRMPKNLFGLTLQASSVDPSLPVAATIQSSRQELAPALCVLTFDGTMETINILKQVMKSASGRPKEYMLGYFESDMQALVVAPRVIVTVSHCTLQDHFTYLVKTKSNDLSFLAEAARTYRRYLASDGIYQSILKCYILQLISQNRFSEAASNVKEIAGEDFGAWKDWVNEFGQPGVSQAHCLAPYVPISKRFLEDCLDSVALQPGSLERRKSMLHSMILLDAMKHEAFDLLNECIQKWPLDAIDNAAVEEYIKSQAKNSEQAKYVLANMYLRINRPESAFAVYMEQKSPLVFNLIVRHQLFRQAEQAARLLFDINETEALKLLVQYMDQIRVDSVVEKLRVDRFRLYKYLHSVFQKNATVASFHHNEQVKLYLEFERPDGKRTSELYLFLESSPTIDLDEALRLCQEQPRKRGEAFFKEMPTAAQVAYLRYEEQAFILDRTGRTEEAVEVLVKAKCTKKAMNLIHNRSDPALWRKLVQMAAKEGAEEARVLLENAGDVEPDKVLQMLNELKDDTKFDGLCDLLVNMLSSFNVQYLLRDGCFEILKSDCVALLKILDRSQCKGRLLRPADLCACCSYPIEARPNLSRSSQAEAEKNAGTVANRWGDQTSAGEAGGRDGVPGHILFQCAHVYHVECLRAAMISSDQAMKDQRPGSERLPRNDPAKTRDGKALIPSVESESESRYRCVVCQTSSKPRV